MIPDDLRGHLGEELGGVFYLHGDNEVLKEAAAHALVSAHLAPGTDAFDYDVLRGSDVDMEALTSALGTPPMMGEWRAVLIRETEALATSPRTRKLIVGTATAPPPGLALVLLCRVPDGSKASFYRDLASSARSVEFRTPNPNDLPGWLMSWSRERHGREMDEDAARALAQAVGADVSVLAREVEKLSTMVDEGEAITLNAVEASGTYVPRQDRWQWFDLVGERRFDAALRGLPVLLDHGESGVGLVIGLATHLLRLGIAVDSGSGALKAALPPRQQWLARRYAQQASSGWTVAGIEEALAGLLDVDRLLKSGSMSDLHLLETWMLARLSTQERAA